MNENANNAAVNPQLGLTQAQVEQRIRAGKVNITNNGSSKTVGQIIKENVFTFFNIVNFILAGLLIYVGSYKNLLFMGVVILNIFIGIFQEIKAKRTIDRLSLIARAGVNVIRDGLEKNIPDQDLVEEDVMALEGGEQIPADAEVLDGSLEVNESLLTGESVPIEKKKGDKLLSGSFVVSGKGHAIVTSVGNESFAGKLSTQAKAYKRSKSEIQDSLDVLIKAIALTLIPLGIALFVKEHFIQGVDFSASIISTSAALIALIPGGLVLLTSTVFVLSVIRLSRYHTLVQQMASTETLARVDVLCLDKTGTITEGQIALEELIPVNGYTDSDLRKALVSLTGALDDSNPTIDAARKAAKEYKEKAEGKVTGTLPFSSERKLSAAEYTNNGKTQTYVMGAGNFVIGENFKQFARQVEKYTSNGQRVLLLAKSNEPLKEKGVPSNLDPMGLLVFSDIIRPEAPATLDFFDKQGVELKIISGDDPATAAAIAKRAGLKGNINYVDATTLKTQKQIEEAIAKYKVFGRVTPEQKKAFVDALKKQGHTVAMTGDGVNDVLALKEADTSIAMASGSDAARSVANLVLLDSNFASLPKVVAEGRRQINNLQRSASLFLSKTIFSTLASLLFLISTVSYPFSPIQLTLINSVTIGIPSFVLALEPNSEIVRGKFFTNVLRFAIPAGLTTFCGIMLATMLSSVLALGQPVFSTISVYLMTFVGFLLIYRLSVPFNLLRGALLVFLVGSFAVICAFFGPFFNVSFLEMNTLPTLAASLALELALFLVLDRPEISEMLAQRGSTILVPLGNLLTSKKNRKPSIEN